MDGYFAENPNYVKYERLLIQLHELIAQGKGDDDEAEEVRDRMDEPGRYLNKDEVTRLKALSTDLYQRQPGEVQDFPFVRHAKL